MEEYIRNLKELPKINLPATTYLGVDRRYADPKDFQRARKFFEIIIESYLDPEDQELRKKLARMAFSAAYAYYKDKNYRKAVFGLNLTLRFNKDHPTAQSIINTIKGRYPHLFEVDDE